MIKYSENVKFEDLERVLQRKLMLLDRILDVEIIATSGLRTPEHNAKVGGVPKSSHLKGLALDLACADSKMRYHIIRSALIAGFTRIVISIVQKDHVHIDCDPDKPQGIIGFED